MNKERLISYRKFCIKYNYSYCVPENFKLTAPLIDCKSLECGITDEEGEAALEKLKKQMPTKAQTRYNQRDIKKRNEKLRNH